MERGSDYHGGSTWASAIGQAAGRLADLARDGDPGAVGIVVSAQAPNEEVFLLRRLGAALGARMAGISWSPPGAFHDDFLVKADKNPNTSGLRLQGLGDAGAVDDLIRAAAAGELRALVLHRTDLTAWRDAAVVQAALERVPCLVVIDTDRREVAAYADVVLPLATYAECDGTFTNHAGRVQRFHTAVAPPAEARPGWAVLGELVARLGGGEPPASAAAASSRPTSGGRSACPTGSTTSSTIRATCSASRFPGACCPPSSSRASRTWPTATGEASRT